jgi:hypothetical protein
LTAALVVSGASIVAPADPVRGVTATAAVVVLGCISSIRRWFWG